MSDEVICCPFCGNKLAKITPIMNSYRPKDVDGYNVECKNCKQSCYIDGPFILEENE